MLVKPLPVSTCHWTAGVGLPLAAAVKVALPPNTVVCGLGAKVTTGGVLTVTGRILDAPVKQLLLGVAVTFPDVALTQLTIIDVVPWPVATLAPAGTVQVYVVAPLTVGVE